MVFTSKSYGFLFIFSLRSVHEYQKHSANYYIIPLFHAIVNRNMGISKLWFHKFFNESIYKRPFHFHFSFHSTEIEVYAICRNGRQANHAFCIMIEFHTFCMIVSLFSELVQNNLIQSETRTNSIYLFYFPYFWKNFEK